MGSFRSMAALIAVLVGASFVVVAPAPVEAGQKKVYKDGTRVKGYTARRGGYSYDQFDTINTYGDSRGRFGSAISLRDPQLGRQTEAGPFDHGFFFDSGIGRNGGDAPYMR